MLGFKHLFLTTLLLLSEGVAILVCCCCCCCWRRGACSCSIDHLLGEYVVHVPEGGLVNHCHEMVFLELDDLHDLDDDADELGEDLHPKKCPKSVGLNGAVLMMMMLEKSS